MDVLQYTAFNQQVDYQKQIREKEACYRTLVNEKVATSSGGGTANLVCWLENIEPCLLWDPVNPDTPGQYTAQPKYWDCIPQGSGWTSGIKVCDDTGYYRCGRNCSWTVPSGVTCARFQLWGAGSSSGSAYGYSDSPLDLLEHMPLRLFQCLVVTVIRFVLVVLTAAILRGVVVHKMVVLHMLQDLD